MIYAHAQAMNTKLLLIGTLFNKKIEGVPYLYEPHTESTLLFSELLFFDEHNKAISKFVISNDNFYYWNVNES